MFEKSKEFEISDKFEQSEKFEISEKFEKSEKSEKSYKSKSRDFMYNFREVRVFRDSREFRKYLLLLNKFSADISFLARTLEGSNHDVMR